MARSIHVFFPGGRGQDGAVWRGGIAAEWRHASLRGRSSARRSQQRHGQNPSHPGRAKPDAYYRPGIDQQPERVAEIDDRRPQTLPVQLAEPGVLPEPAERDLQLARTARRIGTWFRSFSGPLHRGCDFERYPPGWVHGAADLETRRALGPHPHLRSSDAPAMKASFASTTVRAF